MNIYYRIYKLYQRKISAQQISETTHIPIRTVKDLIAKFQTHGAIKSEKDFDNMVEPFLDCMITKHHKYVMLSFSGMIVEKFLDRINEGLEEIHKLPTHIITIRFEGVMEVDDSGMKAVLDYRDKIRQTGKVVLFLSPSYPVEEYINANNIEESTKVFGTINAFEEHIYRLTFERNKRS
jgi:ABC-type transporter Mla MlaB component